jgi:DMSO/TMAO reductase YedYZ molybdopterin-dependent catalytic subunit
MSERQVEHFSALAAWMVSGDERVPDEQREGQGAANLSVGVIVRERSEQRPHVVEAAVVQALEPARDARIAAGPLADREFDGGQVAPRAGEREQPAEAVARVAARGVDLGDHVIDHRSLPIVERGLEQPGAIAEVPVEAALGGAELTRQRLDAHGLWAATGERGEGGGDPVAARRTGLRGHEPYASVSIRMRTDNSLPPGQRALDRFPRFGTNQGPPPAVPTLPVIEFAGAVEEPATIAAAELGSLPRRTLLADFHCVAGWSARALRWDGVQLREVLRASAAATHVRLVGLDGHWSVMLLEDALADDVLLADHLDGAPLDAKHGAPVRLVAPSHYGFVNVKHLCRIELLTAEPAQSHGAATGLADLGLRLLGYRRFTRARVWEEERNAVLPARAIRLVGRVIGP